MMLFSVYLNVAKARGCYRINVISQYVGDKLLKQYFKVANNKS